MSTSTRLQTILDKQHRLIAHKLQMMQENAGSDRQCVFDDFRRYLAAHEAAAQVCIHAAGSLIPIAALTGERTSAASACADTVAGMEALSIDSDKFGAELTILSTALVAHAAAEEMQVLPWILAHATDAQMDRMLVALQTVPMVTAGNLSSLSTTRAFTYLGLQQAAVDHFGTIPDETISRLMTPDRSRHFRRSNGPK